MKKTINIKQELLTAYKKLTPNAKKLLGKYTFIPEDKALLSCTSNKKTQYFIQKQNKKFVFGYIVGNLTICKGIIK